MPIPITDQQADSIKVSVSLPLVQKLIKYTMDTCTPGDAGNSLSIALMRELDKTQPTPQKLAQWDQELREEAEQKESGQDLPLISTAYLLSQGIDSVFLSTPLTLPAISQKAAQEGFKTKTLQESLGYQAIVIFSKN